MYKLQYHKKAFKCAVYWMFGSIIPLAGCVFILYFLLSCNDDQVGCYVAMAIFLVMMIGLSVQCFFIGVTDYLDLELDEKRQFWIYCVMLLFLPVSILVCVCWFVGKLIVPDCHNSLSPSDDVPDNVSTAAAGVQDIHMEMTCDQVQ